MEKKDAHLEKFKSAITSTIKSISKKKDFEIHFGKTVSNNKKNIAPTVKDGYENVKLIEKIYKSTK